jgi:hypothetical protein
MTNDLRTDRPNTVTAAGELRQTLRDRGWRSDLAWIEVGARSASGAVHAAGGGEARRTVAYLSAVRALDGGALRLWKDGAVPVPPQADVREVMLATAGVEEWISELFEAPATTVETVEGRKTADLAA